MRHFAGRGIDDQVGLKRRLVGIRDAGEFRDLAPARSRVQALDVTPFAGRERGTDIDLAKRRADDVSRHGAEFTHRGYGSHNDHETLVTEQAGDFGHSPDVFAAVRMAEAQALAQPAANVVPVEDGDRNTVGHRTQAQAPGDRRFAGAG